MILTKSILLNYCAYDVISINDNASPKRIFFSRQGGAALVVSLILLLIMTIIGVTSIRTTILEEKMAGNMRDKSLSFQATEAVLRYAENILNPTNLIERPFPGVEFSCPSASCIIVEKNTLTNLDNWSNNSDLYTQYVRLDDIYDLKELNDENLPQYVVEELEFVPDELGIGHGVVPGRHYYRIVARGVGGTGFAQSMLETTYTRRF